VWTLANRPRGRLRFAWTNHINFQVTQPGSSTVTPIAVPIEAAWKSSSQIWHSVSERGVGEGEEEEKGRGRWGKEKVKRERKKEGDRRRKKIETQF
jgi:hypothetical protein